MPAFGRLRPENHEFKASLSYMVAVSKHNIPTNKRASESLGQLVLGGVQGLWAAWRQNGGVPPSS